MRSDIEKKNGPEFWRSLEELAGSADFREMMHREFPKGASELVDAVSRRGFFKLMGSSLALAGMTACTKQPFESIVPYVKQPEELVLGQPMFYATAFTLGGYGAPLLVTSREFRPIKIEGNDRHPGEPGWNRCLRAGLDSRSVRSGPRAGRFLSRQHRQLERAGSGAAGSAECAAG